MTCTHCGDASMAMAYRLRFTTTDEPRDLELFLCHGCLWALCDDPDVELVEAVAGEAGLDRVRPE